jgi:hypothetical protein
METLPFCGVLPKPDEVEFELQPARNTGTTAKIKPSVRRKVLEFMCVLLQIAAFAFFLQAGVDATLRTAQIKSFPITGRNTVLGN